MRLHDMKRFQPNYIWYPVFLINLTLHGNFKYLFLSFKEQSLKIGGLKIQFYKHSPSEVTPSSIISLFLVILSSRLLLNVHDFKYIPSSLGQIPTLKATTVAWSNFPGISLNLHRTILRWLRCSLFVRCFSIWYSSGSSRVRRFALKGWKVEIIYVLYDSFVNLLLQKRCQSTIDKWAITAKIRLKRIKDTIENH